MKTIFLTLTIAVFLISGCAGMHGGLTSTHDRFSNTTINQTTGNDLSMGFADKGAMLLDARQEVDGGGKTTYSLVLSSFSLGYAALIPIPFTESLFVIADEKRFAFSTGSHQGVTYFYPASKEQLYAICMATNVEVRVVQITGEPFEKKFNANNRATFHNFADKYLKP